MEVPQRQLILVQLSKLINFMIRVKAYLNEPDSNYETYVSVLLAARLADKRMLIRLEGPKTGGFCGETWTILLVISQMKFNIQRFLLHIWLERLLS